MLGARGLSNQAQYYFNGVLKKIKISANHDEPRYQTFKIKTELAATQKTSQVRLNETKSCLGERMT